MWKFIGGPLDGQAIEFDREGLGTIAWFNEHAYTLRDHDKILLFCGYPD
jgi:hypothetical protein